MLVPDEFSCHRAYVQRSLTNSGRLTIIPVLAEHEKEGKL
jgi:hypothetical protein